MTTLRPLELADRQERETAATTFDRNVVVTAGAGTGKTRLLVDRLVHLLMRHPDVKMTQIVALTFTNKAANEMKLRLRERLESYLAARLDREPASPTEEETQDEIRSLMERYRLSKEAIDRRSLDALRQIERSEIGTIHSFAATLLRLYPMEAGVDPQFLEDDGTHFERLFDELWGVWLDQELSHQRAGKDAWKKALRSIDLADIRKLALSLCPETVDLQRLTSLARDKKTPEPVLSWLQSLKARADSLLLRHPDARTNEKLVRASLAILQRFVNAGSLAAGELNDDRAFLLSGRSINKNLKGWDDGDVEQAQELLRAAKALCEVDEALSRCLGDLLTPFVENFREAFTREGLISFDGLLVRARNLVRDHPKVREALKRRFKALLIDEFQDTDPIQYEILIYLAEEIGRQAGEWRKVKLVPGKIFVVGDPKQSIYAFRRADIEAYLEVIEKLIKAQNGVECRLTTNFRSTAPIVDVVNGVFSSLIQAQPGVQPPYIGIHPAPERNLLAAAGSGAKSLPPVLVRKVVAPAGEMNAEKARRLEGESLAAWLKDDLLDNVTFVNAKGEQARVQPKDVAILFRKLTDIYDYLEPLRRRSIRYVVEGERHFYAAKEIIDAVNLIRAVDNPHDLLALVGVLRSPLGGVTYQNIYYLLFLYFGDHRESERLTEKDFPPTLVELYRTLAKLHDDCRTL